MSVSTASFRLNSLLGMGEALCHKCHAAPQLSGDSWCLACTACEAVSCELRSRWGSHELRRLAADQLVDQSKAIKTLRILSLRLRLEGEDRSGARSGTSTSAGQALGATGKAKAGPPPKAPPILKEAPTKEFEEVVEEKEDEVFEEESEYSSETSEEEEVETRQEVVDKRHQERKSEPPKKGAGSTEVAEVKKEKKRKHHEGERSDRKASRKKESRDKKDRTRRRGRRGGSKHQQVHRQRTDPTVRVHRKKSVEQLQGYKEPPYPPPGKEWRR